MNNSFMQLALREMRAHFSRAETYVICGAIALVLTLIDPFGAVEGLGPRFLYWLTVVILPYAWGYAVNAALRHASAPSYAWGWLVLSAILTGIGVTAFVLALNAFALDFVPAYAELPEFIGTIFAISAIITFVFAFLGRRMAGSPTSEAPAPPAILVRLPLEKRGALIALSVEDHYVRVRTAKGEELVLMRLSDAIREVGNTEGAQVHRSHWAAFSQVVSVRREGDRAILSMSSGPDIPVSRANLPKLREAGLMPERA